MTTTYTAWITTDASALDTDGMCDVVVLANDTNGCSTGDPLWRGVTTVPSKADDRDDDEATRQAKALLVEAGWRYEGDVEGVPTGYIIAVSQSS